MRFELSSRGSKIAAQPKPGPASEAGNHCARESILGSENCRNYGAGAAAPDLPRGALSRPPHLYDSTASWAALAGCFYVQCFVNYLTPCFGIFFGQKLKAFPNSSWMESSIFTLHIILRDLGSALSPAVVTSLGHRGTSLFGLLVASASFTSLAFIDGSAILYIAYGIFLALSEGFLFNTVILILPLYFEKYRRPAFSFMTAAMGLSGVITPRLVRYLIDFYGYSGGLLLYGGCLLQACAFVVLFEPHRKFQEEVREAQENLSSNVPSAIKNESELKDRLLCRCNKNLGMKLQAWFRDIYHAMKNQGVLLMAISRSVFHSSFFIFYAFLPFLLESYGYSPQFSAGCISNSCIMNFISRVLVTFFVDYRWLPKRCLLVAASLFTCAVNIGFIVAIEHEKILAGLSFVYGFGIGIYVSVFYAILIDVVGLERYRQSLAVNALFLALSDTLLSSLLGVIRELSGSYLPVLSACAAMKFAAAALLAALFYRMTLKR